MAGKVVDWTGRGRIPPAPTREQRQASAPVQAPPPPKYTPPSARAMALGTGGRRLTTGIATLDDATRGGIPLGRILTIVGAPGSCKTTLATNLAMHFLAGGAHVAMLAADEPADGILIRFGQHMGLDRRALEDGDPFTKTELANRMRDKRLILVDGDEDLATVEDVSGDLADAGNGAPSVLIVDSIQKAMVGETPADVGRRAEVDAVMAALLHESKACGHLVIALSEAGRGLYRSKDDRIDPLAAGKESSSIEYGAAVLLAMRECDDGTFGVAMAKNRLGPKKSFKLTLDRDTAKLREVAALEGEDVGQVTNAQRFDALKQRVLLAAKETELRSATAVYRHVGGNKADALEAVREMKATGQLVVVDGVLRPSEGGSK